MSNSLLPHGLCKPWNSPGQNTGVGNLSLLKRIFPTQGSNPSLPPCRWILYCLSHQGSPRILEWVAYPFSRGSSWPRNWTGVLCIAGGFFTSWATRETHTNLLASSIRCQTEESRTTTTPQWQTKLQKVNQHEKAESYVPVEGTR